VTAHRSCVCLMSRTKACLYTVQQLSPTHAWRRVMRDSTYNQVCSAEQVRAMQIIDELETRRRGPYGGGIGHVGFAGSMDMALALRTMVIPNPAPPAGAADGDADGVQPAGPQPRSNWIVHLQVHPNFCATVSRSICCRSTHIVPVRTVYGFVLPSLQGTQAGTSQLVAGNIADRV